MHLASKKVIQNLLKKYQLRLSKRLGQNFLIDRGAIKKIIKTTDLTPQDVVLEIGPGIGTLTIELAEKVKKVIAIEKDPGMRKILKDLLECWNVRNVEIIREDILKLDPKPYALKPYKVIGNLPFYLTAPVIRKFLEYKNLAKGGPKEMVLVVQKEVGQRICAKPPDMNLLAVSVQFYAKPEIVSFVSRKSFWPQPKVDSAILRIVPLIKADRKLINADLLFEIVKAGFSQPRKQLINNLSQALLPVYKQGGINRRVIRNWLLKNNIQPNQRAETLTIEDWIDLTKSCKIK